MNACWQSSLGKNHNFCFVYIYLSFHLMQYSWNIFTILCKLPADSAKRAVSSAYIITNNLTQLPSSCSNSSDEVFKPVTLLFSKSVSKSFKYMENRKGSRNTPCLLPLIHVKKCTENHYYA